MQYNVNNLKSCLKEEMRKNIPQEVSLYIKCLMCAEQQCITIYLVI